MCLVSAISSLFKSYAINTTCSIMFPIFQENQIKSGFVYPFSRCTFRKFPIRRLVTETRWKCMQSVTVQHCFSVFLSYFHKPRINSHPDRLIGKMERKQPIKRDFLLSPNQNDHSATCVVMIAEISTETLKKSSTANR